MGVLSAEEAAMFISTLAGLMSMDVRLCLRVYESVSMCVCACVNVCHVCMCVRVRACVSCACVCLGHTYLEEAARFISTLPLAGLMGEAAAFNFRSSSALV